MAHMLYVLFAEKANKEGFPNVARLFRAIAYAERVHANNHFDALPELKGDLKVVAGVPSVPGVPPRTWSSRLWGRNTRLRRFIPPIYQWQSFRERGELSQALNGP